MHPVTSAVLFCSVVIIPLASQLRTMSESQNTKQRSGVGSTVYGEISSGDVSRFRTGDKGDQSGDFIDMSLAVQVCVCQLRRCPVASRRIEIGVAGKALSKHLDRALGRCISSPLRADAYDTGRHTTVPHASQLATVNRRTSFVARYSVRTKWWCTGMGVPYGKADHTYRRFSHGRS